MRFETNHVALFGPNLNMFLRKIIKNGVVMECHVKPSPPGAYVSCRRQKTDLFKLLSWPRILSRSQKFGDYLRSKWKFVSFWKYSATHHSTLPVKNVTPLRNSGHGCNPCKTSIVPFWHDSKNHPSRLGSSSKVCSVFSCVFRVFSYVFKSPENGIIWLSS